MLPDEDGGQADERRQHAGARPESGMPLPQPPGKGGEMDGEGLEAVHTGEDIEGLVMGIDDAAQGGEEPPFPAELGPQIHPAGPEDEDPETEQDPRKERRRLAGKAALVRQAHIQQRQGDIDIPQDIGHHEHGDKGDAPVQRAFHRVVPQGQKLQKKIAPRAQAEEEETPQPQPVLPHPPKQGPQAGSHNPA